LNFANIGDAGMEHVCRLGSLEELELAATDVSDASVDRLGRMRTLRHLIVDGRRISKAGLARLRAALQGCNIEVYGIEYGIDEDDLWNSTE
jgi:hypothetical protein